MTGLEIVFLACTLVAGQKCQDIHIPLLPEVNTHQCMLFGQQVIAGWVMENSNWAPSRGYTCGRVGTVANL